MLMAGRYSPEFGEMIADLLARHRLSYTQASIRTGGAISPSYWSHLTQGRVPSREKLRAIVDAFPADNLHSLWPTAGYTAPVPDPAEFPVPPGARWLNDADAPVPVGPVAGADEAVGAGDAGDVELMNLGEHLLATGGRYVVPVRGDCLEPMISSGDLVVVARAMEAAPRRVVVIRLKENWERGELGDGYSLKVWQPNGAKGAGFYRTDGSMAFGAHEAEIVGRVVGVVRMGEPEWNSRRATAATYKHYKDRY